MDAFRLALRYLERRARTEQEIRHYLTRREVPSRLIGTVLAKLKEYGYVNDAKFALDFQRARNDYKPMGLYRIKRELSNKGVPKEIVSSLEVSREKEYHLALEAAKTRVRQYQGLDRQTFYRRLAGFLSRRGFGYDTVKKVIDALLKDHYG